MQVDAALVKLSVVRKSYSMRSVQSAQVAVFSVVTGHRAYRFITADARSASDTATHKWMAYVRGPRDSPGNDTSSYVAATSVKSMSPMLHFVYRSFVTLENFC